MLVRSCAKLHRDGFIEMALLCETLMTEMQSSCQNSEATFS
jgi:hypothetical protein